MSQQQQQQRLALLLLFWQTLLLRPTVAVGQGVDGSYHVHAASCYERADCDATAETMRTLHAHMHNGTAACENFWDHACGDWTAAPYYNHVDTFGAMANQFVDVMMRTLWPAAGVGGGDGGTSAAEREVPRLLAKLRDYFFACRAVSGYFVRLAAYLEQMPSMRALQWSELRLLLAELGDRAGPHVAAPFDWLLAVAELRRHGVNGVFFEQTVGWASNDATRYVVELTPPADTIAPFASRHELLSLLLDFELVDGQHDWQLQLADELYELDMQLRRLCALADQDDAVEALTLTVLSRRVPQVDWQRYFGVLLDADAAVATPLLAQLPVQVVGVAYLRGVAKLLAATPPHIVRLYVWLRLCRHLSDVAPQNTDAGCMLHMGVMLPLGVDFVYERYAYRRQRDAHKRVLAPLMERLKAQFERQLEANHLGLDDAERAYLLAKLRAVQLRVGNLPLGKPLDFYERYYDAANVSREHFYHNHWEMLRHRAAAQHAALLSANGRLRHADDYFVNDDVRDLRTAPYFVHQRNLLVVPMMFLQMPFFDHRQAALLQYSLVGWILAHELQHGFERDGVLYDADGNENLTLGGSIRRRQRFVDGMRCLERTTTASIVERMADVNGFQLVYDAYFGGGEEEATGISGDDAVGGLTSAQLFFLQFAQFFCGALPTAIDHDRDDVRVHAVVVNMPEFAAAFNCSAGQREHPALKCQMWRKRN